uniref:CARD domain-containing protein n=1 Tax=Biomphalaria glabrata TaxID=6526 RepID=A0A2C9JRF9_BIOGL
MEADVAIHKPEKWASTEASCYEQTTEKVKFIYSSRLKEKAARRSGQKPNDSPYALKPSKSYDNELETNIGKEARQRFKPRDDFGLGYRQYSEEEDRSRVDQSRPSATFCMPYQMDTRDRSDAKRTEDLLFASKKEKAKDKSSCRLDHSGQTKKTSSDHTSDTLHSVEPNQYLSLDKTNTYFPVVERILPVDLSLKKDQLNKLYGPNIVSQRPTTLLSSSPSMSTPATARQTYFQEKTSPLVILEVKDGPTLFYKPANRMVTDTTIEETGVFTTHSPPTASNSADKSFSTSLPETARQASSYVEFSPKSCTLLDEPSSVRSPSLLPRAIGLRKPDLSVLKKSSRPYDEQLSYVKTKPECSSNVFTKPLSVDNLDGSKIISSPRQLSSNAASGTELFISRTSEQVNVVLTLGDTDTATTFSEVKRAASPPKRDLSDAKKVSETQAEPSPKTLQKNPEECGPFKTEGFFNTSEMLQQRAGIKHDDIVVGPRRHPNPLMFEQTPADSGPLGYKEDIVFDQFVGESMSEKPYLPPPKPVSGIPQSDRKQRKKAPELLIFSEQNVKGMKTKGEVKSVKSQEILTANTKRSVSVESGPSKSAENSLERMSAVGGSLDRGRWRPKEKKSSSRPMRGKAGDFGYSADKGKSHQGELTPKLQGNTEHFGRTSKLSIDTKQLSKSTSSSPARQKQLPSPSGAAYLKTKLSTSSSPGKKHPPPPSRLHMLSNIPVPMSHDPPARRTTSHPQKVQSQASPTSYTAVDQQTSYISVSNQDTAQNFTTSSEKDPQHTSLEKSLLNHTQPLTNEDQKLKQDLKADSIPKIHEEPPVVTNTPSSARKKIPVLQKKDARPSHAKASSNDDSKLAADASVTPGSETCPDPDQSINAVSTSNQPQAPPAKPRLHRSAEQLVGEAKLSVFTSTEDIKNFDTSGTGEDKVTMDRVGQLKKDRGLAKIGILRRGSDRTELFRRGSDRGIPLSRNDPSVEDLKKATSLKELCQSVASLLNIDNEKAAEMITTSLSQRQDLVEGLDADAILDYLSHHGVLDPSILVGLDKGATPKQRNSTIIRHVEEHGTTAVALFINALRQSGQLHLASSLDTEQRIKPVSGDGYFGKERHKGEVTVRVELEALKILAPREPRTEKLVDTSLLSSPSHPTGTSPDSKNPRDETDDEDLVKPKSCWCFCFSRKSKAKKMSQSMKKESEKNRLDALKESEALQEAPMDNPVRTSGHEEVERKNPNVKPHRTKSKEKTKKDKDSGAKVSFKDSVSNSGGKSKEPTSKKAKHKSKSKHSGKYSASDNNATHLPEVQGEETVSNGDQLTTNGVSKKPDKDNWDPIVMEYDPKLELVKLRAGQEELASPTRQYGQMGMICEQWKSSGRHYAHKASLLCNRIIQELHTEIIKYFEQDRSTLVLDVISDGTAILIINICMLKAQVKRLQQEVEDGSLISKMEDMFFSKVDIMSFDIRGVKLKIVLDDQQVITALSELS